MADYHAHNQTWQSARQQRRRRGVVLPTLVAAIMIKKKQRYQKQKQHPHHVHKITKLLILNTNAILTLSKSIINAYQSTTTTTTR